MTARRALFLSGSFGKGHTDLAEACADSLVPLGVESTILDCMPLLGRGAAIGDRAFRTMLAMPPVYDAYHFSQLRSDGRLGRLWDARRSTLWCPSSAARWPLGSQTWSCRCSPPARPAPPSSSPSFRMRSPSCS